MDIKDGRTVIMKGDKKAVATARAMVEATLKMVKSLSNKSGQKV
jgi:hypothetical protein